MNTNTLIKKLQDDILICALKAMSSNWNGEVI